MAVTSLAKPGDFVAQFFMNNRTTVDTIQYGITIDGKIYRARRGHDTIGGPGGIGTYVDTGVVIPDITILADM
jgi:hypothetical protein